MSNNVLENELNDSDEVFDEFIEYLEDSECSELDNNYPTSAFECIDDEHNKENVIPSRFLSSKEQLQKLDACAKGNNKFISFMIEQVSNYLPSRYR